MIIADSDRVIPAHIANDIDQRCSLTDSQRRMLNALTELRSIGTESRQEANPLQLGRTVKRWAPRATGHRAVTTPATVVATNKARLSDALALASVPAVTAVIQDVYTDAYTDGDAAVDNSAEAAPRLAALLDEAKVWAGKIVDALAGADPDSVAADADAQAESIAGDAAVAGDAASTLDTAESSGNQVRWVLDSDNACQVCQDAADGSPYDPSADDLPDCPAHKGCECTYEEVSAS